MSNSTAELIRQAIASHPDPETGRPLEVMGQIRSVAVDGDIAEIDLALSSHSLPIKEDVKDAIESKVVAAVPGVTPKITVNIHERPSVRLGQIALRVKSVIAVGSGKGGVGKSTVAASIALTLNRLGSKVGLLDADVYGPSVPQLLGLSGRPAVNANKKIEPVMLEGKVPVMSMGFLVEPDQAVIWRGPMLHGSINQFLADTNWGELDYLIIDMPPGTGDVALTLSQAIPLAGAVVVCTPQEVALLDAVKAISMFRKVNIPLLGMVENMSGFLCPDNGKTYDIFGQGGARTKSEELNVPFLGCLPIDITLRTAGDEGKLAEVIASNEKARAPFDGVAKAMVREVAFQTSQKPNQGSLPVL